MDDKTLEKFLPIGSIVLLKDAKKRLMITGFCAVMDEDKKMFDYSACLYPEGVVFPKQYALFNHDQIEKVFFIGYSDDEEKAFKEALNKQLMTGEKESV